MVVYGVENHYELTGDSEETKLFRTHEEALAYLVKKFEEYADEDGKCWNETGDQFCDRDSMLDEEEFHAMLGDEYDFYRLVKYEL